MLNDIEKKVAEYEKRSTMPYIKLIDDQFLLVDKRIIEGDRERITQSLQCTLSLLSPYIHKGKKQLKKRILDIIDIYNNGEFIEEAKQIRQGLSGLMESF